MANPFLDDLFKEMAKASSPTSSKMPVKDCIPEAQDFVKRYHEKEEFRPGDLIVWKPGMKDSKFPAYDEPIVVLETFEPSRPDGKLGTPYEYQRRDIRCLVFKDTDGELLPFVYDSCKFTKYVSVSDPQDVEKGAQP